MILVQASAPPMLMDMSDGYKYVGQKGVAAMLTVRRKAVESEE